MNNINSNAFRKMFTHRKILATWVQIRNALKSIEVRDCVDYIEFQLETPQRIRDLREKVLSGLYEPALPSRFESAKGSGSYRVITIPNIEDLIVYRLLADEVYRLARKFEPPNAFFSRRHSKTPIGQKVDNIDGNDYSKFFPIWYRYNQYRTKTLLNEIYNVLVITDITNFFDSVQHSLLFEYLMPLGLPRESIGLLGRLLHVLRPQSGFSPTPAVGLPVDEFDCSRQLAHVFLFEHDRRINSKVGQENYVRWMDDQNIGAKTLTSARHVVRHITASLSEQRLTLNLGKTKFLGPLEVSTHFHLEINEELDKIELQYKEKKSTKKTLVEMLNSLWVKALKNENYGNWDKILKRFYGYAAIIGNSFLIKRTYADLVNYPTISSRIFEYYISRKSYIGLIDLFEKYVSKNECLYESVALAFFETVLASDPPPMARKRLRSLALQALSKDWPPGVGSYPKQSAALCLYWLGDKRNGKSFMKIVREQGGKLPESVIRALISASICLSSDKMNDIILQSVKIGKPSVASLITSLSRLRDSNISELPGKKILFPRYSWLQQRNVYDARMWLRLEILTVASSKLIRDKINNEIKRLNNESLTATEMRCLKRVARKMNA